MVLALALGYFAFDKFALSPQREAALQQQKAVELDAARKEGRSEALVESYGDKSIAVLPFVDMSPNKDQEYSLTASRRSCSTCWRRSRSCG
jgi:hypothetical protein